MGKVTTPISYDKIFLNKLLEDPNACVEVQRQMYHLALHPFHLTDINTSVKENLNSLVAKYDKKFGGILLGFHNIKQIEEAASVNLDSCFLHINIEADFYIFKPEVGTVVNGVANKKSKDHVGCLVHKAFNVSLPKPEDCENWLGNSVQLGQEVQLEIIMTDFNRKLPYIRGKILSISSDDSGFSTSEELNPKCKENTVTKFNDSESEAESYIEKKRKRKSNTSVSETEVISKRKKNKLNEEEYVDETRKAYKKHKAKKNNEEFDCSQIIKEVDKTIDKLLANSASEAESYTEKKRKRNSSICVSETEIVTKRKKLDEEEHLQETPKAHKKHKAKKKNEEFDCSQIFKEVDESIDKLLTDKTFTKKQKKHKKSVKETEVSENNISTYSTENSGYRKKKNKHKQLEDTMETLEFGCSNEGIHRLSKISTQSKECAEVLMGSMNVNDDSYSQSRKKKKKKQLEDTIEAFKFGSSNEDIDKLSKNSTQPEEYTEVSVSNMEFNDDTCSQSRKKKKKKHKKDIYKDNNIELETSVDVKRKKKKDSKH